MARSPEDYVSEAARQLETHDEAIRRLTQMAVEKAFETLRPDDDAPWKRGEDDRPLTTVE